MSIDIFNYNWNSPIAKSPSAVANDYLIIHYLDEANSGNLRNYAGIGHDVFPLCEKMLKIQANQN
jgi:hypothetical protein